ncbi:MAG: hypothetical protein ABIK43_02805 [candidate division WOR-3 bacterium]
MRSRVKSNMVDLLGDPCWSRIGLLMFRLEPPIAAARVRQEREHSVRGRMMEAIKSEHRVRYWPAVAVLAALGFLALLVPGLKPRPAGWLVPEPETLRPEFAVMAVDDVSFGSVKRSNVTVLVSPGADDSSLRRVLDWALYDHLAEFNGRKRRHLQVVWVYALDDSLSSLGEWRAMAVWVDPRLPAQRVPDAARLGGDAVSIGTVQYDFTNPVRLKK